VSGLAEHYTVDQIIGKKIVVICNLPHRNMRGTTSQGMVFAASHEVDGKKHVQLLEPQDDTKPGDKVFVDCCEGEMDQEVKPKRWTRICGFLNTNENGNACYKDTPFRTSSGPLKSTTIKNGTVS